MSDEKIDRVRAFRAKLIEYRQSRSPEARTFLNENVNAVKREVVEAGCFKTVTMAPPPAVGGMMVKNADPFDFMFTSIYGLDVISLLVDVLDQTIGALRDENQNSANRDKPKLTVNPVVKGFVFIAMPMSGDHPEYDDVHDAIKSAADNCGLTAERVDEVQSNERITDRLLESIRKAEFVVADLTDSRPNVFYEAGYAYGLGKIPIYIAKKATNLEFDLKDYPIIFFSNMRELRIGLEGRFRGLSRS